MPFYSKIHGRGCNYIKKPQVSNDWRKYTMSKETVLLCDKTAQKL